MKMKDLTPDQYYCREVECNYKGERYSVRDNGAVLRHSRIEKRLRKYDNHWTFGKPNNNGYLLICSEGIHRIVATAFNGQPPTSQHVVDHIDTNRKNNRPENLQWLTKLENILNNPRTRDKIEFLCGIENFLKDPSILRNHVNEDPNFGWMRTVTPEEAQNSWQNINNLRKKNKGNNSSVSGSMGEWVFERDTIQYNQVATTPKVPDIIKAKTLNAVQRNWRVPSEFPCCPQSYNDEPILAYAEKLRKGLVFCQNDAYSSLVSKSAISDNRQSLYVISESTEGENALKPWALAKITYEDGLFVHSNLHNFFTQEGAEKQYCIAQGLEWNGADSMDDYC